jgi:hypothetical protein
MNWFLFIGGFLIGALVVGIAYEFKFDKEVTELREKIMRLNFEVMMYKSRYKEGLQIYEEAYRNYLRNEKGERK